MAGIITESDYIVIRTNEDCICMICGGYGVGIEFESKIGKTSIEICANCLKELVQSHLGASFQRSRLSKEEFLRAYEEGKSDLDIGKMLGINALTVKKYRNLYRLPPKGQTFGLSYDGKKKAILRLFQEKGVITHQDVSKGFRTAFTRFLFDPDVDVVTFRFVHRGTGRFMRSAYELFQDDVVGKTVYFLKGDKRIIDFIASRIRKPVTMSNAKILTQHLRGFGFTKEEAHIIIEQAGYKYSEK